MQINMGQGQQREAIIRKPSVVIGQLKKESERLDREGNVIDPRTRQVIKPKDE